MANGDDHKGIKISRGCTCLRLRKASRRVSQIYDQHLEPFGLTVTQYGVLGHIDPSKASASASWPRSSSWTRPR